MSDDGAPYRAWLLVGIKPDTDLMGTIRVKHIYTGATALGMAQDEQRRWGGFVIEALGWLLPVEAESPSGQESAVARELMRGVR